MTRTPASRWLAMRRVFLSYRRDDSKYLTGFIYQHLEDPDAFGPGSVFMDIDDIPDGIDFRDVIDEAVGRCEFFLIVIGRHWVTPRLMDANDFVRLEIEAALRRKIPVTPVLVDGATMPREDDLPPSLHPLRFKQARTIRHGRDFKADVLQMVARLHTAKTWLADRAAEPTPGERRDVSPPVPKAGDRTQITLPGGAPMTFAWCPPGTFLMGSPATEEDRYDDERQYEVRLTRGFYAGVHPVTVGQFKLFAAATAYRTDAETDGGGFLYKNGAWTKDPGCTWRTPTVAQADDHPVVVVSHNDASAFARWAALRTNRPVRLLTEAEWEYAARGGTATPFYWGDELNGTHANCCGLYPYGTTRTGPYLRATSPVGRFSTTCPHPWGLCDVIGNVWEWCADRYGEYPVTTGGPCADPTGATGGPEYVNRGGSWNSFARLCRAGYRSHFEAHFRDPFLGFRLAVGRHGSPS